MIKKISKIFQKQRNGINSRNFSIRNSINLITYPTKKGKIILFFSSIIAFKLIEMFFKKKYPVEIPEKLQNLLSTDKQVNEKTSNLSKLKMNIKKLNSILTEQMEENDVYLIRLVNSLNSETYFDNSFFYNKIYTNEKDIKNILCLINFNEQSQYKENIIRLLGITDPNEFNDITFILKTKEEIYYMTKSNQNPEIAKKVISGMNKINTENDLFEYLQNKNDDCINIIVPRIQNISFNIIKKFFQENSFLFSESSLNFIQIPNDLAKKLNLNTGEFLVFNPYFIKSNSDNQKENIVKLQLRNEDNTPTNREVEELSLIRVNIFSPQNMNEILLSTNEFTQESASSIINLDFDCQVREKLIKYYEAIDLGFNEFTKFLDYMLDPIVSKETKYPEIFKRNVYNVESPHLASFYKKKIFSTKDKFLYIYLNEELLNKSFIKIDFRLFESTIGTCLSELKKEFKGDERINSMRVIISKNPSVNDIFLIFPNNSQNMVIRYIDYGKIAYYNTPVKNKSKYIIKDLSKEGNFISSLTNDEKNYIFPLKYNFNEEAFNSKTLKNFIKKCLINKLTNYLEEEDVDGPITSVGKRELESLSPKNFEQEILNKKGKKIVLIVDPKNIGYNTSYSFILNFMHSNQDSEVKYYLYNKFNDNLKLNKFKSVPYMIVYEDDKIIEEIDFYEILEKEIDPTVFLTNKLEKLL